ncbi:MAG TPA: GNAT family N-acetyltransferase [Opitutaceae bacterium]|jgi:GNAT superfamily N-acetyltransferase
MNPAAARPSIAIRDALLADLAVILSLIRDLAAYERLLDEVEVTEARLQQTLFPAGAAQPSASVVLGELNGAIAGFAVYFYNYSTFLGKPGLYLEDLFVRPEARGQGLGAALLRHLVGIAADRGCGRMEWAVLDWNSPAIEFYSRMGAKPMNDWTVFRLTGSALSRRPLPLAGSPAC